MSLSTAIRYRIIAPREWAIGQAAFCWTAGERKAAKERAEYFDRCYRAADRHLRKVERSEV